MKFLRKYTCEKGPYHGVAFEKRSVSIRSADGATAFEATGIEVPAFWSQTATDLLASKYLWRGGKRPAETSARQAIDRLATAWRVWGETRKAFDTTQDADVYYDEMRYLLIHQMASPNSPQWFNTGLFAAYGETGPQQGHFFVDATGKVNQAHNSYEHPQAHACFIQSVRDDLVNDGGIMDLWVREARLFKFGSGSGSNFSALRGEGEPLGSGGVSSGLLSFLRIGDSAAGAIRSGGTTRRAAKMVCVDVDHPDVVPFIEWKAQEERKVASLIAGSALHRKHLLLVWKAALGKPSELDAALVAARSAGVLESFLRSTIARAKQGMPPAEFPELGTDWRDEAYGSVSGQNSNNSVRVSAAFMAAVEKGLNWDLLHRRTGNVSKSLPAKEVWNRIAQAAWECADPGLQFESTISSWHTCPASGPIRASNPCSEYLFLDDTGCNLASFNVLRFFDEKTQKFDVEGFAHAIRLWTLTLDLTVSMAGYPSHEIADRSTRFRTLGLGFANVGALLMAMGLPYGSPEGNALIAALSALLTGQAYLTSAELAAQWAPFNEYEKNKAHFWRVMRNHETALSEMPNYEGLTIKPPAIAWKLAPAELRDGARAVWKQALALGKQYGFRNAQVTAIAPTGTIGLVMDCDTTGIEPEFALVKFKKLAGGGVLRIPNRVATLGLRRLGYDEKSIAAMEKFYLEHSTLEGAPGLDAKHLPVFDCAHRGGSTGTRSLSARAHLEAVAMAQPFISGGVSKTINLPEDTSVEDVRQVHEQAWRLGLKAVSIYREGCKLSQPLGSVQEKDDPSCMECG